MQEKTSDFLNENKTKNLNGLKLHLSNDEENYLEQKFLNFNKIKINFTKENKNNFVPRSSKIHQLNCEERKVKEGKGVFQRSDYKPKTIAHISDHRKLQVLRPMPQTSIEKIVKIMNKIKLKLISIKDTDLVSECEWAIKEILSDNMYKIKIHEKTSKEESDFYNEYSNNNFEILLSRDINDCEKFSLNDKEIKIPEIPIELKLNSNNIPKLEEFGPEFDVFDFSEKFGRENLLLSVSQPIFHYKNINKFINFSKFPEFINQIRIGYTSAPNAFYHTDYHAADILQTALYFCNYCKFDEIMQLEGIDILSLFFSALIHDYKHPGFTNLFLNQTFSEVSTNYNDKSPLENFHLAEAFKLLQNQSYNIFDNMKTEVFKIMRKRTIECILSTDMALHSKIFGQISSKLNYYLEANQGLSIVDFFTDKNNSSSKFDLQQEFLNYILHIDDIAHPAKPWTIEIKWSELIHKEFFNQGDLEKNLNLPVSFLCDRHATSIPKSQIGFIKNIIMPSFSLMKNIIPLSEDMNKHIIKNLEKWMMLEEENTSKDDIKNNRN